MNKNSDDLSISEYRVLARKYRPQTFSDLIGQETLVKTLANALQYGRLAHAFVLTGVRGIGKTRGWVAKAQMGLISNTLQ